MTTTTPGDILTGRPTVTRALTLHPEWAWALTDLGRDIELRKRPTVKHLGHWLAIHAGRAWHGGSLSKTSACSLVCRQAKRAGHSDCILVPETYPTGAIVAVARVVSVTPPILKHGSPWALDRAGLWVWQWGPVIRLATPVECRGAQGIWRIREELVEEVITSALAGSVVRRGT